MADKSRTKRTKRRVASHIKAEIERLHVEEGLTPREIEDRLYDERADDEIPDSRTIRRYVQRIRSPKGEAWSLSDCSDPGDAPLVLEALAVAPGFRFQLSREEGAWIVRVRKAAPDLTPRAARTMAHLYAARAQQERDTWALDALLAFAPWRNLAAFWRYRDALGERRIPASPVFWAHARDLGTLWRRMGFSRWLIASANSYAQLRDMDERLERGEKVTVDIPQAQEGHADGN